MHFGAALHLLRTHAGLSLRALAAEVGVSAAYLSRVEHGHDAPPSPERAAALAHALGLPGDTLTALLDDARLDGADWLSATPSGRRLASELRRRSLTEAQLGRVLAFVLDEFPRASDTAGTALRTLLDPARVLLRVHLGDVRDGLLLAALRLSEGEVTAQVHEALLAQGAPSAIGGGFAVASTRGGTTALRACLLVLDAPLDTVGPDAGPVRCLWVLSGLGEGPQGALALARVARLADARVAKALVDATTSDAALALLERFERLGTVDVPSHRARIGSAWDSGPNDPG